MDPLGNDFAHYPRGIKMFSFVLNVQVIPDRVDALSGSGRLNQRESLTSFLGKGIHVLVKDRRRGDKIFRER